MWENGEKLTKDDVLRRMAERGVVMDREKFTGLKSGLTRKAYRFNLPLLSHGEGAWRRVSW